MAQPIRMPPLAETTDEVRIVGWLKAEGDKVRAGEPLLEVETDKATLEVEAAAGGSLLRILHGAGSTVSVGAVVGWIGEPGEEPPAPPDQAPVAARAAASPAVRRLAHEHGIDLSRVRGSGPGGRIEKADVEALIERAETVGAPVSRHRRALARRLARSTAVPQFSLAVTVDMTRAAERLEREQGFTYTHLLLRAIAASQRSHPALNRVWVEDGGPCLRPLQRADVGLAVVDEDDEQLLVVTVPEPDRLEPAELVGHVERAVAEARASRVSARYRQPAAVTLSNLGGVGVERFTAIVDPDQTAIVAAGAVALRPGVVEGAVRPVLQLELTLTADHRVVDGVAAGRFIAAVRTHLETDP